MPKVALIATEGCYASSLTGFMDLLQVANAHARKQLGDTVTPFQWRFLSLSGKSVTASGGLPIAVESALVSEETFDLIYIPGVYYGGQSAFDGFLKQHSAMAAWLTTQWQAGAIIAANCTGTFLLAEVGLLNNHQATTTWWLEQQFRRRYPRVQLDIKQLLTEDDRLVCAGAITTHQHLALRMVERFFSPAIASLCAKALLVDIGQTAQAPYLSLAHTTDHGDKLVARAQYRLQQDLRQNLSMKALAYELAVSQRTLIRRFNSALGIRPLTYLQNLRIEAAKHLLESSDMNIETVIYEVGYEDVSSFSRLFHERTGLTPTAYRERFKRTPH